MKKQQDNTEVAARIFMSSTAVRAALDISASTLIRLVRGERSADVPFPKPTRAIGTKRNYWLRSSIEEWAQARLAK
jgi:predicted DNA-binding transcriptional regulator AlpA